LRIPVCPITTPTPPTRSSLTTSPSGLPWRRFPVYLLAQFLGGFVGSGVVYANYINAINNFAGHGVRTVPPAEGATAQIFCTYPAAFMTIPSMFFSEFIASALLIIGIFALKDKTNTGGIRGDGNFFPLGLFFLIFGLGVRPFSVLPV